jgi:glycine C-acetyltransferase
MALDKLEAYLTQFLDDLQSKGTSKGAEKIITGIIPPTTGFSERYLLAGYSDRAFLRMNSNGYLGLARHPRVIQAETKAAEAFGTGPGAVRFISGSFRPHIELEKKLASFHGRESAMIMSAAYATVMGVLPRFITEDTLVISDALNHNCIINAIRLSRPAYKVVYNHLDMNALGELLLKHKNRAKRVCVVTDGIFSMRGDHAPLDKIDALCRQFEQDYEEGVVTIVDDSHGVGAFGNTGRGTEEYTGVVTDLLIATLGKALGVNGGYVVSSSMAIEYLRESAPFYIYSNPITPAEAAAAIAALDILDSDEGLALLEHLRDLSARLRQGLTDLGYETIQGEHPIVPVLIRDTGKTTAMVKHLFENNILATGLNYPVVPKGEEEIRLQVSANHTGKDIELLLNVLEQF